MPSVHQLSDPDRIQRVMSFLSDSIADYLGARTLFLSRLPQQAAILSSTAIEKACKAVLAFHGNSSHGHLKKAHWNAVNAFDPRLFGTFDMDFLALNKKAYALRYTDDLPVGFNLVIATREFLASLDDTLMTFHRSFRIDGDGQARTKLQALLDAGDDRLTLENHIVQGLDKNQFILKAPQLIYEVRFRKPRGLLETLYWSARPAKSAGFLREGCRIVNAEKEIYEFSHYPIEKTDA